MYVHTQVHIKKKSLRSVDCASVSLYYQDLFVLFSEISCEAIVILKQNFKKKVFQEGKQKCSVSWSGVELEVRFFCLKFAFLRKDKGRP